MQLLLRLLVYKPIAFQLYLANALYALILNNLKNSVLVYWPRCQYLYNVLVKNIIYSTYDGTACVYRFIFTWRGRKMFVVKSKRNASL